MKQLLDEIFDIIHNGGEGFFFKDTELSVFSEFVDIKGIICFEQIYEDIKLYDEYKVQIIFPFNFPNEIPIVNELNNRIPSSPDYHNNKGRTGFCLGTPGEISKRIFDNPSIEYFISYIVLPFLYANTYREQYGNYPWETRAHFGKGLVEYYQEFFNLENEATTKKFLLNIAYFKKLAHGHIICPCGSGLKFRKCHQAKYIELLSFYSHKKLQDDVFNIIKDNYVLGLDDLKKQKIYTKEWYNSYKKCIRNII